ncbi:MAG: cytochrome c biogenesis protein [Bdellovibrionia bacterium]
MLGKIIRFQISFWALGLCICSSFAQADSKVTPSPIQPSSASESVSPHPHSDWSFFTLGLTPIQNGGRMKPLDSFAQEVVLFETGSRTFQNWKALDLILSWITYPEFWQTQPFIRVAREDLKRQLGLDESRTRFSPQELTENSLLAQYASGLDPRLQSEGPPGAPSRSNPREQELKSVLDRISLFQGMISGQAWLLLPQPAPQAWLNITDLNPEFEPIRDQFVRVLGAYQAESPTQFERFSHLLKVAVEGDVPNFEQNFKNRIWAEVLYNRGRPFLWAWILYLSSALLWGVSYFSRFQKMGRWAQKLAWGSLSGATLLHLYGFALRCFVAGRPPVTNMYESVVWVALGVVAFAAVIYFLQRQTVVLAVGGALASLALIAADSAPAILDPSLHPLVPVLRSNYWLTVHVLTITLGYAAFALSLGISNITLFQFLKKAKASQVNSLNQLNYRSIQFGVVFIAAGTILGGIWADESWGRFWGWDPKEVWALITLLCYLVILHGRYASWVGQFGFAVWSVVSFLSVIMAWYGVNFILGVGLHSYGFSTGGSPWVLGFVGLQMLFVLGVAAFHWIQNRGGAKSEPTAPALTEASLSSSS